MPEWCKDGHRCRAGPRSEPTQPEHTLPTSYQAIACRPRVPFLPWRGATPGHGGACPTLVRPDPASFVCQCHLCMGVARTELRIGAYSDKTPNNSHQRGRNRSRAWLSYRHLGQLAACMNVCPYRIMRGRAFEGRENGYSKQNMLHVPRITAVACLLNIILAGYHAELPLHACLPFTATRLLVEQELVCSDVICPFWGITGAISLSYSKGSH